MSFCFHGQTALKASNICCSLEHCVRYMYCSIICIIMYMYCSRRLYYNLTANATMQQLHIGLQCSECTNYCRFHKISVCAGLMCGHLRLFYHIKRGSSEPQLPLNYVSVAWTRFILFIRCSENFIMPDPTVMERALHLCYCT